MKILVTGGAGYVGTSLIEKLEINSQVKEIIIIDNLVRQHLSFFLGSNKLKKVQFVQGDILDTILLERMVSNVDYIFHLAAQVSHPYTYQQNVLYEQINRWGTLNLVRTAEKSKNLKKFIYLSSTAVYGFKNKIMENEEVKPDNSYGTSKYAGEQYISQILPPEKIKIIRSGNVFGFNNCLRIDSVINNFIFNSFIKKKITIYGNGHQNRPFVFLDHLISNLLGGMNVQNNIILELSVDFNAEIEEVKNWILTKNSSIQYNYVNQNEEFGSQSFSGFKELKNCYDLLDFAYQEFENNIRIIR